MEQEGEEDQGSDGKTAGRKTCESMVFNQEMLRRGWSGEERFAPATLTRSGIKPEEEEDKNDTGFCSVDTDSSNHNAHKIFLSSCGMVSLNYGYKNRGLQS